MKRSFTKMTALAGRWLQFRRFPVHSEGSKESGGPGKLNFPAARSRSSFLSTGRVVDNDVPDRGAADEEVISTSRSTSINKAGGGTTDGMVYANGQEADGHTILQVTPVAADHRGAEPASIKFSENFIPIGNFQIDIQSLRGFRQEQELQRPGGDDRLRPKPIPAR
jgi:hypothetical protein